MLEHLYCHQMITQTHPKGDRWILGKINIFKKKSHVRLNHRNNTKVGRELPLCQASALAEKSASVS